MAGTKLRKGASPRLSRNVELSGRILNDMIGIRRTLMLSEVLERRYRSSGLDERQ